MLTSQQIKVQEELQTLISYYEELISEISIGKTKAQKYDFYLRKKYVVIEQERRDDFNKITDSGKDGYLDLPGYGSGGIKDGFTLAKVAFWFGMTYEEAFMLFWFNGKNLLSEEYNLQEMNKILQELNTICLEEEYPIRRMAILDDLIIKHGILWK